MKLETNVAIKYLAETEERSDAYSRFEAGLEHSDMLVRHACAINLCHLDPRRLTDHSIGAMFMNLHETFQASGRHMPIEIAHSEIFDGGDLQQDTALALSKLAFDQFGNNKTYIPIILQNLEVDPQFYELTHLVICMAFPLVNAPISKASLSDTQIDVLEQIAKNDAVWRGDGDLIDWLAPRGLPSDQTQLKRYISIG